MTDSSGMNRPEWLESSAIAVIGARGSGKTALCYSLLDQMERPVFVYDHPRPELIEARGWKPLYRLEDLYNLSHAVVYLDEPQVTMPVGDKRANIGLQRLLSLARHRDLTLLFSTCDTRWVNRALEAYVDIFIVKDIEAKLVKMGSICHKVIKRHVIMDPDEFALRPNQYLVYGRNFPQCDGLHEFSLPTYWNDSLSKPYSLDEPTAPVTAPKIAPTVRREVRQSNGKVAV